MTISELIKKLEQAKDECGDVVVMCNAYNGERDIEVKCVMPYSLLKRIKIF